MNGYIKFYILNQIEKITMDFWRLKRVIPFELENVDKFSLKSFERLLFFRSKNNDEIDKERGKEYRALITLLWVMNRLKVINEYFYLIVKTIDGLNSK